MGKVFGPQLITRKTQMDLWVPEFELSQPWPLLPLGKQINKTSFSPPTLPFLFAFSWVGLLIHLIIACFYERQAKLSLKVTAWFWIITSNLWKTNFCFLFFILSNENLPSLCENTQLMSLIFEPKSLSNHCHSYCKKIK